MQYEIRRTSKVPNSPMRVMVDDPTEDTGGFGGGGTFEFMPAGHLNEQNQPSGLDRAHVSEHAARIIMEDEGMAKHFTCSPKLPEKAKETPAESTAPAAAQAAEQATKAPKAGK